jgi:hypothetical protein
LERETQRAFPQKHFGIGQRQQFFGRFTYRDWLNPAMGGIAAVVEEFGSSTRQS